MMRPTQHGERRELEARSCATDRDIVHVRLTHPYDQEEQT